jgi:hypothetical protein
MVGHAATVIKTHHDDVPLLVFPVERGASASDIGVTQYDLSVRLIEVSDHSGLRSGEERIELGVGGEVEHTRGLQLFKILFISLIQLWVVSKLLIANDMP